MNKEQLAQLFHETYERLAPDFNYNTRKASAVAWADVPANNKELMIAVANVILAHYKDYKSPEERLKGQLAENIRYRDIITNHKIRTDSINLRTITNRINRLKELK